MNFRDLYIEWKFLLCEEMTGASSASLYVKHSSNTAINLYTGELLEITPDKRVFRVMVEYPVPTPTKTFGDYGS